jgi:hypothetical protein
VWTAGRGGVDVAGWVTDTDLLERVELVRAPLPDADHGSFAQDRDGVAGQCPVDRDLQQPLCLSEQRVAVHSLATAANVRLNSVACSG